ncbi:hypothetical protein [Bacillus sp. AFS096315]|uniref:DUF7004 family protein n=1 Tax=Bacillus sp. AFS096315 TaxID=2033517 RepID=UPI000BEC6252|nr:hypothetical protein [Bacillus sp. AFS096315]PEC48940.1 hypothetical protein CON00_15325 [Bacillus sp. AFS096315]
MPDRRFRKEFSDGTLITVGKGKFDDWCLYENRRPLLDSHIFSNLETLHDEEPFATNRNFIALENRMFQDLENGNKEINMDIINNFIPNLAKWYLKNEDCLVEKTFTILYLTMLAEENKVKNGKPSVTGLKIKSVAGYQIMIEEVPVDVAVKWSNKRPPNEIIEEWKRLRESAEEASNPDNLFPTN